MVVRMNPITASRTLVLASALALLAGCAYTQDRLLDITDIVDVRGGAGGFGLGAKVRATEFLETGIAGGGGYREVVFYGRRKLDVPESDVLQLLIAGYDMGGDISGAKVPWEMNTFFLRGAKPWAPPVSWWRFGGEVILPGVRGGLYLNIGEILDFVLGFTTLDIAKDDGLGKGEKKLKHWPSKKKR